MLLFRQVHNREALHKQQGKNLRDIIFGANDGFVSSLALVAGMAGAFAENKVVIVAGLSGLVAGGISMALGAYLSAKSEVEYYQGELDREKKEIIEVPAQEKNEIREIYQKKGFEGENLDKVVEVITSDRERWLNIMMEEELGLKEIDETIPARSAIIMGGSFTMAALIPLIPFFFFPVATALVISIVVTIIANFLVGAAKTFVTARNWFVSGLEMLLICVLAFAVSYSIGIIFSQIQ